MLDRHDLNDAEWARLEPLLPDRTPRRGGRWNDHRQVINGILADPNRVAVAGRPALLRGLQNPAWAASPLVSRWHLGDDPGGVAGRQ